AGPQARRPAGPPARRPLRPVGILMCRTRALVLARSPHLLRPSSATGGPRGAPTGTVGPWTPSTCSATSPPAPRHVADSLRGRLGPLELAAHPGGHPNSVAWL